MEIGADEKSRLTVQQLGADAQTITERGNHYQQERQIGPGFSPIHRAVDFFGYLAKLTSGKATDFHHRDGIIFENLLRGGRLGAVQGRPAGSAVTWGQREVQLGILANTPDEGGPRRQVAQSSFVGVASVTADDQLSPSRFRALI